MELAVHGSNQGDIEDLEGVVVCRRVSARGEEVEAVDAIFARTKVTADGDGLCERGGGADENDGQKPEGEKECGGHGVYLEFHGEHGS